MYTSKLLQNAIYANSLRATKFPYCNNSIRFAKTNVLIPKIATFTFPTRSTHFMRSSFPNINGIPLRHGGHSHGPPIIEAKPGKPLTEEQIKENQIAERITWLGLASNVVMSIGKAIVGVVGNSTAMIADAAHNFGDLIADVVTLVSLKLSRKPSDSNHPHGHGRFETVGALTVGALLIGTGVGIGHHSIEHIMNPHEIPTTLALYTAIASIIVKEALFQGTMYIGKKQNSQLLKANAWHHRGDAISSVVALIGIVGAQIGYPALDPIAGLAVAVLIIKIGVETSWESLKELTDTLTDSNSVSLIHDIALTIPGVDRVSNIRTRKMGHYTNIDLTVHVNPKLSVSVGHQISDKVMFALKEGVPRSSEVLISVVPSDNDHHDEHHHELERSYTEIEKDVKLSLSKFGNVSVAFYYVNDKLTLDVHLPASDKSSQELKEEANWAKEQVLNVKDVNNANVYVLFSDNK